MTMPFTILLDCDGPLANFTQAYLDSFNYITGEFFNVSDVTGWGIPESLGFKGEELRRIKDEMHQEVCSVGFCEGIRPQPWAEELFSQLSDLGQIIVVTSPWTGSTYWMGERANWLQTHFGMNPKDIIFAHRKYMVRGDCLIDDKVDHVFEWSESFSGREAILFPLRSNRDLDVPPPSRSLVRGVRRAINVDDVVRLATEMKIEHFGTV